jgi:hypothetical protein
MVEFVCGLEQRKKLEGFLFSNYVTHSRITDIFCNNSKNITKEMAVPPFPFIMQLSKTTDIPQCSQLLVFVHYVHANDITPEFLFCESIMETTKTIDVLEMVKYCFLPKQNFAWK